MIVVNKLQTPITDELLESLPQYVREELIDSITRITFIEKLISPTRPRASSLTRFDNPHSDKRKVNPKGKIRPDYVTPHILENMSYFRPAALYFQEHGKYTLHYPSSMINSEYMKFWLEERKRCKEGYMRESDGEWITGYNYYYWNYSPIMLAVAKETGEEIPDDILQFEAVSADRIEDFPMPWDMDYFYYHYLEEAETKGKYGAVLKTRGRGYSFKAGSKLSRNYQFYAKSKNWAFASAKGDLIEDGLLSKAWDNLDFINEHTPWRKQRHEKNTIMNKKASYLDLNTGSYKGFKSEINGITTKNNPESARGKRGKIILIEEAGRYLDLLKVWGIARPSMEQGSLVFGLMVAFGTGGTEGAAFQGLETLFYQGSGYRVLTKPNVFDKTRGEGECAFYCGEYTNRENAYDEDGNSDVVKALIEIFYARYEVLKSTTDSQAITQEKADRSITPQEAVMRTEGTIFPISDLKDHLAEIKPIQEKFVSAHHVGRISLKSGFAQFEYDFDLYPIRTFPSSTKKDKTGAIEIFVHPIKNGEDVPNRRYIIGVDPYDDDTGTSLGSCFVFDLWTDRIVAEYTGRPKFANDFYEVTRRLAVYYNALINYENNNKGLFGYFNNKNCVHLLADNPRFLKDTDTSNFREVYGNKAKGTRASKEVNALGRRLQRDWLLTNTYNDDEIMNLQKIRALAYLEELIAWNPDGNFDRVSSMGMVMIQREEMLKYIDTNKESTPNNKLADDDYWKNN